MNFFRNITSNLLRTPHSASESSGQGNKAGRGSSQEEQPGEDDAVLVSRAQSGDYKAFDELVTRHRGKVYAMIMNMVKNDADAWDLAQDAFIKAWKALPKFENRSKFSTWLFRISHNVVYDKMRKKKIQSEGELDDQLLDANRIDMTAATAPASPIWASAMLQWRMSRSSSRAPRRAHDVGADVVPLTSAGAGALS